MELILHILSSTEHKILVERCNQHLKLRAKGYSLTRLTPSIRRHHHKQIENEIIEVIITFKEKGMKRQAISNYIKPVIAFCKISDIYLNVSKNHKVYAISYQK